MNSFIGYTLLAGVSSVGLCAVIAAVSSPQTISRITEAVGVANHDKLGWLDDAPLTEGDRRRIAELSGTGFTDNLGVIRSIQSGSRGSVLRRDFELLRQDRRRARAAYPDVSEDDLYDGTWLSVDVSDRVPDSFCTSGNSNGTEVDGKTYLDGGCYMSVVKAKYPKREDAVATKRVLAELADAKRQKEVTQIKKWGYSTSMSGSDGSSLSVEAYPDPLPSNQEADDGHVAGQAVVIVDQKTRYQFPFVATDWIKPPWSEKDFAKLSAASGGKVSAYVPVAEKPWVMRDGLLAHGEKCREGRLCFSQWNGDGYDNKDIGPANPASWVLDQPFSLSYFPAPDNGEQRSDPKKPWYLVITYYGFPLQISGGWTEQEAKKLLPTFQTGYSFPMGSQDPADVNHGNLKEARATQIAPVGGLVLKDRATPTRPEIPADPNEVPYHQGMTLMPGQSTRF
ncbi:MAG: hypothetical protein ACRYGG_19710 [Janthinobacterium lividum]